MIRSMNQQAKNKKLFIWLDKLYLVEGQKQTTSLAGSGASSKLMSMNEETMSEFCPKWAKTNFWLLVRLFCFSFALFLSKARSLFWTLISGSNADSSSSCCCWFLVGNKLEIIKFPFSSRKLVFSHSLGSKWDEIDQHWELAAFQTRISFGGQQ